MLLKTESVSEFFRERIRKARQRQRLAITELTEFYVVNLLAEFLDARKLLGDEKDPDVHETLALTLTRALAAPTPRRQFVLLKNVGDRSLYVAGFFGDSFKRKIIDIDYYVTMGEIAYRFVSDLKRDLPGDDALAEIFRELSDQFKALVDLLAAVSEESGMTSDRDLLRLYERWAVTRSNRLLEKLKKNGILPVEVDREKLH